MARKVWNHSINPSGLKDGLTVMSFRLPMVPVASSTAGRQRIGNLDINHPESVGREEKSPGRLEGTPLSLSKDRPAARRRQRQKRRDSWQTSQRRRNSR